MIVYLLTWSDGYDLHRIIGIYSTEDKAWDVAIDEREDQLAKQSIVERDAMIKFLRGREGCGFWVEAFEVNA